MPVQQSLHNGETENEKNTLEEREKARQERLKERQNQDNGTENDQQDE